MELPVFLSAYFPRIRILAFTPFGILEKCTKGENGTYIDSYDVGVGKKSLKEYKEEFNKPKVLGGVSFMGKVSLPDELVEGAVIYEMLSKFSQEIGNHYPPSLLLSLSKYNSELEEGIGKPKGKRDEVLGHLFSRIDENFPSGTLKREYRSKSQ